MASIRRVSMNSWSWYLWPGSYSHFKVTLFRTVWLLQPGTMYISWELKHTSMFFFPVMSKPRNFVISRVSLVITIFRPFQTHFRHISGVTGIWTRWYYPSRTNPGSLFQTSYNRTKIRLIMAWTYIAYLLSEIFFMRWHTLKCFNMEFQSAKSFRQRLNHWAEWVA